MHVLIILILSAITLSACATRANYDAALQTWVGKHSDQLVDAWGPPDSVYERSDKTNLLTYHSRQIVPHPYGYGGMSHHRGLGFGFYHDFNDPVTETRFCKTTFGVNRRNIITHYQYSGDSCYISEEGMQQKAYPAPNPSK